METVSMRTQRPDIKKASCSVHKMSVGGNVVVLGAGGSYAQSKDAGQKMRINYEGGQCFACCSCRWRRRELELKRSRR